MGLDMYLTAERYLFAYGNDNDSELAQKIALLFPEIGTLPFKTVTCEAMYWRKANAIHNWFVQNCQDGVDECQTTEVSRAQLEDLIALVKRVLADRTLAGELLPSRAGFFFGNTEYDEWYFKDLENTVAGLETALKLPSSWTFSYRASW
jgi:hypothetical protein